MSCPRTADPWPYGVIEFSLALGFPNQCTCPLGSGISLKGIHCYRQVQMPSCLKASLHKAIQSWHSCNWMTPSLHQANTSMLWAATEQSQPWFKSHVAILLPALADDCVYSHGSGERFGTACYPPLHKLCIHMLLLKVCENPVWSLLRRRFPKSQRKWIC